MGLEREISRSFGAVLTGEEQNSSPWRTWRSIQPWNWSQITIWAVRMQPIPNWSLMGKELLNGEEKGISILSGCILNIFFPNHICIPPLPAPYVLVTIRMMNNRGQTFVWWGKLYYCHISNCISSPPSIDIRSGHVACFDQQNVGRCLKCAPVTWFGLRHSCPLL